MPPLKYLAFELKNVESEAMHFSLENCSSNLWLSHPETADLISSEAKQGQLWLVLGWENYSSAMYLLCTNYVDDQLCARVKIPKQSPASSEMAVYS